MFSKFSQEHFYTAFIFFDLFISNKQKPNIRNQHREMVAGAGSIHKTFYCEFSSGLKLGKHPNLTHIFVIWSQEYQQTTVGIQDYV